MTTGADRHTTYEKEATMADLKWEKVNNTGTCIDMETQRAKVPGGWLVWVHWGGDGVTFYPDPEYKWE